MRGDDALEARQFREPAQFGIGRARIARGFRHAGHGQAIADPGRIAAIGNEGRHWLARFKTLRHQPPRQPMGAGGKRRIGDAGVTIRDRDAGPEAPREGEKVRRPGNTILHGGKVSPAEACVNAGLDCWAWFGRDGVKQQGHRHGIAQLTNLAARHPLPLS